jgi:hypothetical protein
MCTYVQMTKKLLKPVDGPLIDGPDRRLVKRVGRGQGRTGPQRPSRRCVADAGRRLCRSRPRRQDVARVPELFDLESILGVKFTLKT